MSTASIPVRGGHARAMSRSATYYPARYLRFGSYYLDLQREELYRDGARVKLQAKVYQALAALVERPSEVVTREEMRARLWPMDTHVNYDANVNTTVNKLRLALGDSSEQSSFIETIPRKGYVFVARVEPLERMEPPTDAKAAVAPTAAEENVPVAWFERFERSRICFTAGVIALIGGGILAGAAIIFLLHQAM